MAKLPTREALGAPVSTAPGGGIASYDTSAVGRGVAAFGQSLARAIVDRGWQDASKAEANSGFMQFQFNEKVALDEAVRGLKPEEARGFADRQMAGYLERSKAFLNSVPETIRPEYGDKLFEYTDTYRDAALAAERENQTLFTNSVIDRTIESAILPQVELIAEMPTEAHNAKRAAILNTITGVNALIDESGLTETEKFEKQLAAEQLVKTAFFKALSPDERETLDVSHPANATGGGWFDLTAGVNYDDVRAIVDRAEADGEALAKERVTALTKDLDVKAHDGTLTPEEVLMLQDILPEGEFNRLYGAATNIEDNPPVEPDLYMELVTMAREQPDEAIRRVDELYGGHVIGRGVYDRVYNAAVQQLQAPDRKDFIELQRKRIQRTPRAWALQRQLQLQITQEQVDVFDDSNWYFETWLGEHPDATNSEIRQEVDAIIRDRDFYAAQENFNSLPLPRYLDVPNRWVINDEMLKEAKTKLAEATIDGRISERDSDYEEKLILRWMEIVQQMQGTPAR